MSAHKEKIASFIHAALSGDVLTNLGSGLLKLMSQKHAPDILSDIPACIESYGLLAHFLDHSPFRRCRLDAESPLFALTPGILYDDIHQKILHQYSF